MPNTSIGGLVSGLDTATIISQLVQLEARPQTLLKSKVSTEQRAVTALQTFNAKLVNIATKAGDIAKAATWTAMKASSTIEGLSVTADSSVPATSMAVEVVSRATAAVRVYDSAMAPSAQATTASSLSVTYEDGRASATIALTEGTTLQGIADSINNDASAGLKATLVRSGGTDASPEFKLQVTSATTGELSGFTLDDASGSFLGGVAEVGGTNATLKIDGVAHSFSSNTVTDLVPGVDVTIGAGAEKSTGTITVGRDVQSLTSSVKGMVDAVNAALTEIGTLTAYDAATKKGGLLTGDSTLRGVRNQLLESVTGGISGESLATVGIQVDRSGKLTFDEAKFKTAYAADPTGTQTLIAGTDPASGTDTGFADKVAALGKAFSDSVDGTVTLTIKSRQSSIKGMEDDIADWDIRLDTRRTALQRQYTALEAALGKLQSQGNWLAGQIASLPKMSSGQ